MCRDLIINTSNLNDNVLHIDLNIGVKANKYKEVCLTANGNKITKTNYCYENEASGKIKVVDETKSAMESEVGLNNNITSDNINKNKNAVADNNKKTQSEQIQYIYIAFAGFLLVTICVCFGFYLVKIRKND